MIVIGVTGELVFESAVSTRNEELETISNALLRDAQLTAADAVKRAGDAKQSAIDAADAASNVQGSADKANAAAGDAEKKVGLVTSKADDLDTQLRATAARLNTEDLTILAKQSGHKFLPKLFGTLKGLKPAKATVQFVCNSEMETMSFTTELIEGLKTNGWSAERATHCALMKPDEINGITIFNNSIDFEAFWGFPSPVLGIDDRPEADFEVLLDTAFRNVKENRRLANLMVSIGARAKKDPTLADDMFRIVIGKGTNTKNQ